jgi:hypothetical protein
VGETNAASRIKVGADVLPWWPASGVYLLVEPEPAPPVDRIDVRGVAGTWSAVSVPVASGLSTAEVGQRISYCFLDDDPVATAERLRPVLARRWREHGVTPLLAGSFHTVVPHEWHRHLP